MIALVDQRSKPQTDGSTLVTFTFRVPAADEIGGAREAERSIQEAIHTAGRTLMEHTLSRYDTAGEPIEQGKVRLTSKGRQEQTYQSLFGPVTLARHVYQSAEGGATHCPLEERARILENATCHFASIIAAKYSAQSGRAVARDFEESLQRSLSLDYLQTVAAHAGDVAVRKEAHWTYTPQTPPDKVAAIAVGIDGTCAAICEEGYKQVMAGSIDLLDEKGERLETIYQANAPEEGKVTFLARMDREVARLKARFEETPWVGLSDGAPEMQEWLGGHCDVVMLDFYHLSEYITGASEAFGADAAAQRKWCAETLHTLKHEERAAEKLERKLRRRLQSDDLSATARTAAERALHYLEANVERTEYALARSIHLPIGSGVTEAACKHIVKQRVCGSGMRWKRKALQSVLALRSLHESSNRWEQFWSRIERFGY